MTKSGALRGSRTKAAKARAAEAAAREAKTKKWVTSSQSVANALRSKDREFHGLQREFEIFQTRMIADYENSKHVHHPRDVGNIREQILRNFLHGSGLLPKRYAVSETSVRVASTTGHISNELDILLYDHADSLALMRREGHYEVQPIETAYGAIQVKSRLNKKEIRDAFTNIASFKMLDRNSASVPVTKRGADAVSRRPFGIIFAYDSDLDWDEIVEEIRQAAREQKGHVLCNGIFILTKGHFTFGDATRGSVFNEAMLTDSEPTIHGLPDRQNHVLYAFYSILLELLRRTATILPPLTQYFRLPLVSGAYSYEFELGHFAEVMECPKHGPFAKKIATEALDGIVNWCASAVPMNWIRVMDLAYGRPGNDSAAYERQPGDVFVYNPEGLSLSEVLVSSPKSRLPDGSTAAIQGLGFEMINILDKGLRIFLPHYYIAKFELFSPCPKCRSWSGTVKILSGA